MNLPTFCLLSLILFSLLSDCTQHQKGLFQKSYGYGYDQQKIVLDSVYSTPTPTPTPTSIPNLGKIKNPMRKHMKGTVNRNVVGKERSSTQRMHLHLGNVTFTSRVLVKRGNGEIHSHRAKRQSGSDWLFYNEPDGSSHDLENQESWLFYPDTKYPDDAFQNQGSGNNAINNNQHVPQKSVYTPPYIPNRDSPLAYSNIKTQQQQQQSYNPANSMINSGGNGNHNHNSIPYQQNNRNRNNYDSHQNAPNSKVNAFAPNSPYKVQQQRNDYKYSYNYNANANAHTNANTNANVHSLIPVNLNPHRGISRPANNPPYVGRPAPVQPKYTEVTKPQMRPGVSNENWYKPVDDYTGINWLLEPEPEPEPNLGIQQNYPVQVPPRNTGFSNSKPVNQLGPQPGANNGNKWISNPQIIEKPIIPLNPPNKAWNSWSQTNGQGAMYPDRGAIIQNHVKPPKIEIQVPSLQPPQILYLKPVNVKPTTTENYFGPENFPELAPGSGYPMENYNFDLQGEDWLLGPPLPYQPQPDPYEFVTSPNIHTQPKHPLSFSGTFEGNQGPNSANNWIESPSVDKAPNMDTSWNLIPPPESKPAKPIEEYNAATHVPKSSSFDPLNAWNQYMGPNVNPINPIQDSGANWLFNPINDNYGNDLHGKPQNHDFSEIQEEQEHEEHNSINHKIHTVLENLSNYFTSGVSSSFLTDLETNLITTIVAFTTLTVFLFM